MNIRFSACLLVYRRYWLAVRFKKDEACVEPFVPVATAIVARPA
jgi:hypothetical protein